MKKGTFLFFLGSFTWVYVINLQVIIDSYAKFAVKYTCIKLREDTMASAMATDAVR